jgi:hypothetical protein
MSKGRIFEFGGSDLRRIETWDTKQREAAWQKRYEKVVGHFEIRFL